MVLQLFIGLMAIALASLLVTQGRRRKIWSVLILICLGVLAYFFIESLNNPLNNGFIYQWLPYSKLKADFNISSSVHMQQLFLPLMYILAAVVYLSTISGTEQHSLHFNTLTLLDFVALIILASSHDFLQLMFASSMLSVISFYMPASILAKKKMLVFNFLAEIALFTALAIVYGKTGTINLADIYRYVGKGGHRDLVAVLLMLVVGCKCGLFLLNDQYFSLKDITFNRLIGILLLSEPLSGLILFVKLRPLLEISSISQIVIPWWGIISAGWCMVCATINNNLKSKAISLSLAFYALMVVLIYRDSQIVYTLIPHTLLQILLTSVIFILVFYGASGETNVAKLGGFWRYTKLNLVLSCLLIAVLTAEFVSSYSFVKYFAEAYLVSVAISLKEIYFGKTHADEKTISFAQNVRWLYWAPVLGICGWIIYHDNILVNANFYYLLGGVLGVMLLVPTFIFTYIGNLRLWQIDILSCCYESIFIAPLRFFGRILWLAFDVVVIERSIIGSVSAATATLVRGLHKIQDIKGINSFLGILLGLILVLAYLGFYIYE